MIFLKNIGLLEKFSVERENRLGLDFVSFAKEAIIHMLSFLGGLLMASINDFGSLSPFGIAYVTAAGSKLYISAGLGAAAGYILTQDSVTALRYIAAIICAAVLARLMEQFEKVKKFKLLPSCIAFFTCFSTSMVVLLAGETQLRAFFLYLGEAGLAFAATYFFSSTFGVILTFKRQGGLSNRDMSNVMISAFLLLMSLAGITVFGVSFTRIIAVMIILGFSYIFKESGGAIAGISATLIFSMSANVGPVGMAYAVSGLMSGVFGYTGRYVCASVFLVAFGISFLFGDGTVEKLYLLIEVIIASIIFMSVPEKYIQKAEEYLVIKKEPRVAASQRQVVFNRLKSASVAVGEMSDSVTAAAGVLKQTNVTDSINIYNKVQDAVCSNCHLYDFCWNKNFKDSKASFDNMSETLRNSQTITRDNVTKYLAGCCVKLPELIENFNKIYCSFMASLSAQDKIEKIRQVTSEQFGGICSMLSELSEEFSKENKFDNKRTEQIEEMLVNNFELDVTSVVCLVDENNKYKIEFTVKEIPSDVRQNELKKDLETITCVELNLPVFIKNHNSCTVCFCEKTKYKVAAAASKIVADCEKLCGDSFESFYDGRGNYTVVLSDGMGTGMRAAIDSSLAAGMMAKLLKSGFSYNSALKLVNSALLLKSKEESLATLDILNINLYTGQAVFYKAGAALSYIKRKNKMLEIKCASMPVGILKDSEFVKTSGELNEKDIVVLASDGAFDFTKDAVKNALAITVNESVEEISERIVRKAKSAKGKNRCDDITVIAVRLLLND